MPPHLPHPPRRPASGATRPVVPSRLDRRRISAHLRAFGDLVHQAKAEPAWTVTEVAADLARQALGFQTVAVNRYRPTWEDYRVDFVLGSQPAREHLLGTTAPSAGWAQGALIPRAAIGPGVYFFTSYDDNWGHGGRAWVQQDRPAPGHEHEWHPLDTLILELDGHGDRPTALLSLDDPHSGLRPGATEAALLDLAHRHLSIALRVADWTDRTATRRGQLEALAPACARLAAARSREEVWAELCECMTSSLGWGRAVVYVRASPSLLQVAAVAGAWPADARAAVRRPLAAERVGELVGTTGMLAGGCLTTTLRLRSPRMAQEERALLEGVPPGRSADVWHDDVLLFPMRTATGAVSGLLAVESPTDGRFPRPALRQHMSGVVECAQHALERVAATDGVPGPWLD